MADTLTPSASVTHNILPEVMGAAIADAIYSESVMLALMKVVDIGAQPTKTAAFNFAPVETAAASSEAAVDAKAWTLGNATIGVSEIAARVNLTKLAQRSSSDDLMSAVVRSLSSALLELFETDSAALVGGFSNSVGTSGNPLTIAQMVSTLATLRKISKSLTQINRAAYVLYPEQIYDLQIEGVDKANGLGQALNREEVLNLYGGSQSLMNAQSGSFMGISVFSSNAIGTKNTGADSGGGLFIAGDALGAAIKWMPEVNIGYAGSAGVHGDYAHATMCYGVGLLRESGVSIITNR